MSRYSVVIVTHNSQQHLPKCLAALDAQTVLPERVILSDSGSKETRYLDDYKDRGNIVILRHDTDIGFCQGNNAAMPHLPLDSEYVLFLNPDAFLTSTFCAQALATLAEPKHHSVGALSGILLGYDIATDTPTDRYDSTGIFHTWYGHWYDRDKGNNVVADRYRHAEYVPALCGALMFCRRKALNDILLRNTEIWDSTFYMYKDDIDLSLRLANKGWKLLFAPALTAYHCRGWQVDRRCMPRQYRLMSAINEIRINAKHCKLGLPYSLSKYYAVKVLDW